MRQYQRIWESVKNSPTLKASIVADTSLHSRIIKAVKKEKGKDAGWRLLLSEQGVRYKLCPKIKGEVITFTLLDDSPITTHSL